MDCNNCNFKKSHFISAVREIKPGTTLLFFFNDEEYTYDDVAVFNKVLSEHLIENTIIFLPASLAKGVKEEAEIPYASLNNIERDWKIGE